MSKVRIIVPVVAVVAVIMTTFFPARVDIGGNGIPRVIIGNQVSAQEADYLCDGENDHIQLQLALDALPSTGGMIYVLAGNYTFGDSETVTRAIDNVSIVGIGGATSFEGDGSTAIFSAGGDRWLFMNLMADCGGIIVGETDDWCMINVHNCTDHFAVLTDTAGGEMVEHGNEWHSVAFATASALADVVSDLSGNWSAVQDLDSRLDDAELDILVLQADFLDLETWLTGNMTRVDDMETWLSGNVTVLSGNISDLVTWLGTNATAIDNLTTWLGTNVTRIDNLVTWLGTNVTRIDNLVTWLGTNATAIDNLTTWLGTNVTRIDNLVTWLGTNATAIDNLTTWLGTNATAIDNLTTWLGTNATVVDNLETWLAGNVTDLDDIAIVYVIDGGGEAISTGVAGYLEIPFAVTITAWTITADQTGSIVVDVWKDSYANFPPTVADTIAGSEKPTISAGVKGQDLSLGTWTTAVTAGDHLGFNVDSCSTIERVTLTIRATRVIA